MLCVGGKHADEGISTRVGGWEPVSKVLRFKANTLEKVCNGRAMVTPTMALRVARFVGMSVDEILDGKYAPQGTCPHCGRTPDFTDEETVAEDTVRQDGLKLVK